MIKKKAVGEKNVKNAKLHENVLYAKQIKTISMCMCKLPLQDYP